VWKALEQPFGGQPFPCSEVDHFQRFVQSLKINHIARKKGARERFIADFGIKEREVSQIFAGGADFHKSNQPLKASD